MTDPQNLHDLWLVLTVITTLETGGIALYLWKMFGRSSRKWFFWALALAFASVAVEQAVSEVKNLYGAPILNPELARTWVAGGSCPWRRTGISGVWQERKSTSGGN
jgi:hypothetical protein